MRKETWFRGPLLSVLFFALTLGSSPAMAVSTLDTGTTASALCNAAQGLGALSLLSFMGSDILDKQAKSAPNGPPASCGSPECAGNPKHCKTCKKSPPHWQKQFDQAGSKALNTAGKMLGYGAGILGVACTAPGNEPSSKNGNNNGND